MQSTLTPAQQQAIADRIGGMVLAEGIGNEKSACSIAAINLALTGVLTDTVPDCMSLVIGRWIILIQDAMPETMRNSIAWRDLLPLAAGTGRDREAKRIAIIMDWLWTTVLPQLQGIADKNGYGEAWANMLREKNVKATQAAARAAGAACAARADNIVVVRPAFPNEFASTAAFAVNAACIANTADVAAAEAAYAAINAARAFKDSRFWIKVDPPALLARLINA